MYIRLAFSKNSQQNIEKLIKNIEDNKLFVSQLNEKAGLGCHNFHITLIGQLTKIHKNIIKEVFSQINEGTFYVIPLYFSVTRYGYVKLMIKYNVNIIQLVNKIMKYIPEGNGYFTNTHITIGRYFGQNIKEFQNYINNKYNIYKIIIEANRIELDESALSLNIKQVYLSNFKPGSFIINK